MIPMNTASPPLPRIRALVPLIISGWLPLAVLAQAPATTAPQAPVSAASAVPANVSYAVEQVAKLAEAGVGEQVLTSFAESTRHVRFPTADEIVYLRSRGVPDKVIVALLRNSQQTPAAAPTSPPSTVSTPVASWPGAAATGPAYNAAVAQPNVASAPPAPVVVQPQPVYVSAPPVIDFGLGYYNRGWGFGLSPNYLALSYNYAHWPRYGFSVGLGIPFGGYGYRRGFGRCW
jgi:hypothetical protein